MFRVTMSFGGKPVKKFTFEKDQVAIGRDATCEIVIDNIGASRRHAVIERTAEGYVLSDLQSHNGTFVNGEKIFHHRLNEADEFFIGKYAFQFEALEPVVAVVQDAPAPRSAPAKSEMPDMTFRLDRNEIQRIMGLSARGSTAQLVQIAPDDEKKNLVLEKPYYVLGSDETAEIKAPGLFSPAKAGVFVRTEQGWRLLSLSPKLRVGGKRITDVPLQDGDLVQVGKRRFRFCQG
jgi:pSer/pThr/pTyr-binding forkhead associated (FHA) protein